MNIEYLSIELVSCQLNMKNIKSINSPDTICQILSEDMLYSLTLILKSFYDSANYIDAV